MPDEPNLAPPPPDRPSPPSGTQRVVSGVLTGVLIFLGILTALFIFIVGICSTHR